MSLKDQNEVIGWNALCKKLFHGFNNGYALQQLLQDDWIDKTGMKRCLRDKSARSLTCENEELNMCHLCSGKEKANGESFIVGEGFEFAAPTK